MKVRKNKFVSKPIEYQNVFGNWKKPITICCTQFFKQQIAMYIHRKLITTDNSKNLLIYSINLTIIKFNYLYAMENTHKARHDSHKYIQSLYTYIPINGNNSI